MEQTQWKLKACELTFEPPDMVHMRRVTEASAEDVRQEATVLAKIAEQRPFYLLVELGEVSLGSEARKEAGKTFKPQWIKRCVIVGAGTAMKLAIKSVLLALTLFGQEAGQVDFVSTVPEGRDLIAKWKAQG